MEEQINQVLLELAQKAQIIAQNQVVGENRDFYITIEQLHNLIKEFQETLSRTEFS